MGRSPHRPAARAGLDDAQVRTASAAPSELTPLGLVQHLAEVERNWLQRVWVCVHMIEEYARHNGHADIVRERIDGLSGA
jgi:hypothetical protein